MTVECIPFGTLSDGQKVPAFVMTNANGLRVKLSAYGAAIVSIEAPDRDGKVADVVLGYDDVSGYEHDANYLGVAIGRVANRIGEAQFVLDGKTYHLPANEGNTHLHGGDGFSRRVWSAQAISDHSVGMTLVSPAGDQGYPGTLTVKILYTWTDDNVLKIEYRATTDQPTVCDLTNHSYFNLAGTGNTLDHQLMIASNKRALINDAFVPTGEIVSVDGAYDFRAKKAVRSYAEGQNGGHGEYYILTGSADELSLVAKLQDPASGRSMECYTNQNMLVFYDGYFVDGIGKSGQAHHHYSGLCLETQNFANAVNIPNFPSARLAPGNEYRHTCIYKFNLSNPALDQQINKTQLESPRPHDHK